MKKEAQAKQISILHYQRLINIQLLEQDYSLHRKEVTMTTPAHRLIQDQNLNFLHIGTTGGKNGVAKVDKRGGFGGRKALSDISNSRKPSALHSVKKDNPINVLSIDKDPSAAKGKSSRAPEKGKVVRKALTDLTNSVKPCPKQQSPNLGCKLNAVTSCIAEEGFLHNHMECIKAQMTAVDKDYFLKTVGLHKPSSAPLSSEKLESNMKYSKMEELAEDEVVELRGCCSPTCPSPQLPKASYMSWEGDDFSDLMMTDAPKLKMTGH